MMIRVQAVKPLDKYQVKVAFTNGEEKKINLAPFLRGPIFDPIRENRELFLQVTVNLEAGTIFWPNGADIDPDVLYGTEVPSWMETEVER